MTKITAVRLALFSLGCTSLSAQPIILDPLKVSSPETVIADQVSRETTSPYYAEFDHIRLEVFSGTDFSLETSWRGGHMLFVLRADSITSDFRELRTYSSVQLTLLDRRGFNLWTRSIRLRYMLSLSSEPDAYIFRSDPDGSLGEMRLDAYTDIASWSLYWGGG